jgi:tetratricopeptide (TPR) repeat protein
MTTRIFLAFGLLIATAAQISAQGVLLTADDLYIRGIQKLSERDFYGAVAELSNAYQLNDSDARIARALGYALYMTAELAEAAYYYEKAVSMDANDSESATQLAVIYSDPNVADYEKAVRYGDLAVQLDPSSDKALFALAQAHQRAGNMVEAESFYRRFMETFLDSEYRDSVQGALKKLSKDTFILSYNIELENRDAVPVSSVRVLVMLGRDFGSYQKTVLLSANREFDVVMSDSSGNRFVEYQFDNLDPRQTIGISFEYLIEIRPTIFKVTGLADATPSLELAPYLAPEALIESESARVTSVADSITEGLTDALSRARAVYEYTTTSLRYEIQEQSMGAEYALRNPGHADCTEFASLFVALCRAAGVPARVIFGFAREPGEEQIGASHAWAEFYLDEFGWTPVDPTYGSRYSREHFGRIDANHIGLWSPSPLFQGNWSVIVFHSNRNPDVKLMALESAEVREVETVEPDLRVARLMDFPKVVAELPPLAVPRVSPVVLIWSVVFFFLILVSLILSRRILR